MPSIILRKSKDLPALKPKAVPSPINLSCKKERDPRPRGWNVSEVSSYAGKAVKAAHALFSEAKEEQRHKEALQFAFYG